MLTLRELESGRETSVCALVVDGRCLAVDFVDGLPERAQRHLMATLAMVAEVGWRMRNEARFKHLRGDVYEVKEHNSRARLFCFLHQGRLVVCTHGRLKPSGNREYNKEIVRVERLHLQCITERIL
jgi:hypothetical protein